MTVDDRSIDRRTLLKAVGTSALTASLAGCETVTTQRFAAPPAGLTESGMLTFDYDGFGYEPVTERRSGGVADFEGEIIIQSHFVSYGDVPGEEPPPRWPDARAPFLGVLATPAIAIGGEQFNPLTVRPLWELATGPWGRRTLARVGLLTSPETPWRVRPRRIGRTEARLFESTVEVESYLGVPEEDGRGRVVLITLARGSRTDDGDAAIVASAQQRSLTDGEENSDRLSDSICASDDVACSMQERELQQHAEEVIRVLESIDWCTIPLRRELEGRVGGDGGGNRSLEDYDECTAPPSGGSATFLDIGLADVRLVQTVEDTRVVGPGYGEPDPPLVAGENASIVFDITHDGGDLSKLQSSLRVDVERRFADRATTTDRFFVTTGDAKAIIGGDDPRAVFHRAARDSQSGTSPPVFTVEPSLTSVTVTAEAPGRGGQEVVVWPDEVVLTVGTAGGSANASVDATVATTEPIRVGFTTIRDSHRGSNYGQTDGRIAEYRHSVDVIVDYLRRVLPGKLVTYRHDGVPLWGAVQSGNRNGSDAADDYQDAERYLEHVVTQGSFPSNGAVSTDGLSRSDGVSQLRNNGFDVTVLVVPGDYASNGGTGGYYEYHYSDPPLGFAPFNSGLATSVLDAADRNFGDRDCSAVAAQELSHQLVRHPYEDPSGHPMAQRRGSDNAETQVNNVWVDYDHARHRNSDVDGDGTLDPPGVRSVCYDLTDGRFTAVSRYDFSSTGIGPFSVGRHRRRGGTLSVRPLDSFMSYAGSDRWTDARVHRDLITDKRTGSGGGAADGAAARPAGPVATLSAVGRVTADGGVTYRNVAALDGFPDPLPDEGPPVAVSLEAPDGERLATGRVRERLVTSHVPPVEGIVTFALPFPDRTVSVLTSRDGVRTRMNPVVRSVGDAVDRVPDSGFRDEPSQHREAIADGLGEVATRMAEGTYADAAGVVAGTVRERVESAVRREYGAALNQPARNHILTLIDDTARRLEVVAEAYG